MMNSIATVAQSVIDKHFSQRDVLGDTGSYELETEDTVSRTALKALLIGAIRAYIDQDLMQTFSLANRRLALAQHPDSDDPGQVVLIASFGKGPGILGGHHELCVCMDDENRKRLIEVLQMPPTIET